MVLQQILLEGMKIIDVEKDQLPERPFTCIVECNFSNASTEHLVSLACTDTVIG